MLFELVSFVVPLAGWTDPAALRVLRAVGGFVCACTLFGVPSKFCWRTISDYCAGVWILNAAAADDDTPSKIDC